jgi:hypothetical protein
MSNLQESPTMKSIREMSESYKQSLNVFQTSAALKPIIESNKLFEESPAMKFIREMSESYKQSLNVFQTSPALKSIIESNNLFEESLIFKALKNLNNSPFNHLTTNIIAEEQLVPEAVGFINEYLSEVGSEITNELAICNDFDELSDKTKAILLHLYHVYLLPIILSCLATIIMTNAETTRKEFTSVSTADEARSLIRNSSGRFDRNLLKGYRIIIGANTNMREKPSMRSHVINKLPIGTLIEIIDKSDRSWLLVEVEVNGEIEQGWVLRKYTEYFK